MNANRRGQTTTALHVLAPCPFCGGLESVLLLDAHDDDPQTPAGQEWTVACDFNRRGCGAASGYRRSVSDAVASWNMRAVEAQR